MKKNKFIKLGLSTLLSILIIGCGDSTPAEEVVLDANIQKIVDWSQGRGTAPTEADYIAAGVDLHGKNISDINAYIRQLNTASAVDTIEEIDAIAQELGVTILDSDGDGIYDAFDNTPNGENNAPTGTIVREGLVTNVIVDTQVNLTTQSNDSDGDELRYVWYLDEKPTGSTSILSSTNTQNINFTPDKVGEYKLIFQVHDADKFDQDDITITAESRDTCTELSYLFNDSNDVTLHANKCYLAPDGLSIDGKNLTIEEGVRVIFGSNTTFNIMHSGKIIANGTANNPILFTSEDKTAGAWKGLNVTSDNNVLSHVTIEYAETAIYVAIAEVYNFTIKDSIIKNSEKYGIKNNSLGTVNINNTQFISNNIPIRVQKTNKLYELNNSNTFTNNTHSYIESFTSKIVSNQTWKKLAVPYYIWGVDVEQNATLTIEAGTKIFNAGGKIDVEGTLKAIGTQDSPIIFTRDPSETRGNEYWDGIRLDTNSYYTDIAQHHELAFVQIDYAEIGLKADGEKNAHLKFSDSNITNCKKRGLELKFGREKTVDTGKGHIDKFERIRIKDNPIPAEITVNALSFIDTESDFTGNTVDAIVIPGGSVLSSGNHGWKKMSVPLSFGGFTIPTNAVVNIEAGNDIIVGNDFWVYGALNIEGTADNMVTFKGGYTLTGSITYVPSHGIYFSLSEDSPNSNIAYLSIDGTAAASSYNADGIRVSGANVINNQIVPYDAIVNIENSVFNNIAGNGILADCGTNVTQSNNIFTNITDLDVRRKSCE